MPTPQGAIATRPAGIVSPLCLLDADVASINWIVQRRSKKAATVMEST